MRIEVEAGWNTYVLEGTPSEIDSFIKLVGSAVQLTGAYGERKVNQTQKPMLNKINLLTSADVVQPADPITVEA